MHCDTVQARLEFILPYFASSCLHLCLFRHHSSLVLNRVWLSLCALSTHRLAPPARTRLPRAGRPRLAAARRSAAHSRRRTSSRHHARWRRGPRALPNGALGYRTWVRSRNEKSTNPRGESVNPIDFVLAVIHPKNDDNIRAR